LDKELPSNEISNLINRSKAECVIFSPSIADKILPIVAEVPTVKQFICMEKPGTNELKDLNLPEGFLNFYDVLVQGHTSIDSGERAFIDAQIDSESLATLLFTSGTTDNSKCVMLSHRNLTVNLMAMCSMLYIDATDIFLSILPIHHTYECTCGFLCPIYRGSTIAYCDGLRHIPKNMVESKSTMVLGVPLVFEMFYKRIWAAIEQKGLVKKVRLAIKINSFTKKFGLDLSRKLFKDIHNNFGGKIKMFISGAAAIDPMIAKGFNDLGIKLVQGYGLTECSPIVALNRDCDFKYDAAGLPLPGIEITIADRSPDGIGEIIVKGGNVMMGYLDNLEANAAVLKDGLFYTGDLGFIDKDGFVHISGRKKNVIITKNGKNVYPEELEELLQRSDFIKEAVVIGVDSDTDADTVITAIVVPDYEKFDEGFPGKVSPELISDTIHQVIKDVNTHMTLYKYIRDFNIRKEEFDKTTTKKIKRHLI
jgi:long-chain acyl-CoA synthetase